MHKAALKRNSGNSGNSDDCSMLQAHAFCSALICLEVVTLYQVQQYVLLNLPRLPLLAEGGDQRVVARTLARLRSYLKALSTGDVEAPDPVSEPKHRLIMRRVRGRTCLLAKSTFGEDHRQVTSFSLHPDLISLHRSPQRPGHMLMVTLLWHHAHTGRKPLAASIAVVSIWTRLQAGDVLTQAAAGV